jgi:hypothetical protein
MNRWLKVIAIGLVANLTAVPCRASPETEALYKDFEMGRVGAVSIGVSVESLERLLGHRLKLGFAGDHRAGVTLTHPGDLKKLGVTHIDGRKVEDIEIMFDDRGKKTNVEFISVGLSCEDVREIGLALKEDHDTIHLDGDGGWRRDGGKARFFWGGDPKRGCSIWVRSNSQNQNR